jgi:hypothetical protein
VSEEHIRSQRIVFDEAKQSVGAELDEEMLLWDFSKMMGELQGAIKSCGIPSQNKPVRFFSRHYLKMGGERYKKVIEWLTGQSEMSADDVIIVLQTLKQLRDGTLSFSEVPETSVKRVEEEIPEQKLIEQPTSGVIRRIIDHTIGSFNSITGLVVEAGIKPEHAFDSDRMQVQGAVQKVCECFGVAVVFPESETTFGQPLTHEDLAEIGFERTPRRRKR